MEREREREGERKSVREIFGLQVDSLRRSFAERQGELKRLGEELERSQKREKRLQDERDGLQSREEIMDLQVLIITSAVS